MSEETTAAEPKTKKAKRLDGVKVRAVQDMMADDPQAGPVRRSMGEAFRYYGAPLSEEFYVIVPEDTPLGMPAPPTEEEMKEEQKFKPPWTHQGWVNAHSPATE